MQLDVSKLASLIGMLVLEKMSAEVQAERYQRELDVVLAEEEGREANGQDTQGEGHQGA